MAPPSQPVYYGPPPPIYWPPAQSSPLAPSPGLRIFLMVVLALDVVASGIFVLAGVIVIAGGDTSTSSVVFFAIVAVPFGLAALALAGVALRAPWSRWVALAAGTAATLTCLGSVLGIPILISAARAPDLSRPRTSNAVTPVQ